MGSSWKTEDAVTPVVGTLLILAMTVVGMAAVLAWGAPTIETIQAENAQVGMVGELEDLRASSIELSIPDASRIPTVNLPRGTLSLEQGTRIMVTANHRINCDLHVRGWSSSVPDATISLQYVAASCGGAALDTLEVLAVVGSNTISEYAGALPASGVTLDLTAQGVDFSQGNWLLRLTDGGSPSPIVYAEAWLFDTDRIAWELDTSAGGVSAFYDLGAVFSQSGLSTFVEKGPSLQESDAGSDVYSLRVRTLSNAGGTGAISGRGSYQVFLGLVGNYARIDEDDVYRLRFDFQGDLAESWCNTLLLRNQGLSTGTYDDQGMGATYECAQSSPTAVRSVSFIRTSATSCAAPGPCPFPVEVIHANMRVTLGL